MKKIFSILMTAVMLTGILAAFPVSAADNTKASLSPKKIVSVVYDDSGSMKGQKWAYANYAMQSFCAMLNSNDRLYITYMSEFDVNDNWNPFNGSKDKLEEIAEEIKLGENEIDDSLTAIREHTENANTPYIAIEAAYEKLKSVNDSDPNTQYWLVIISDGAFTAGSWKDDSNKDDLNKAFEKFTNSKLNGGKADLNITFLGIELGEKALPTEDENRKIYVESASENPDPGEDTIIGAMSKIAGRISGRAKAKVDQTSGELTDTITVKSEVPIRSFAVFAQGSNAKLKEVTAQNNKLDIKRNVNLSYEKKLSATACIVEPSSNSKIDAGTYTLTFDGKVDPQNVEIFFEPAVELRVTLKYNGETKTIKSAAEFSAAFEDAMEKDKFTISCKVCEAGTDKEISLDKLSGTKFNIEIIEDGKTVLENKDKSKDLSLPNEHELKKTETIIKVSATLEGFNAIEYYAKVEPVDYVPRVVYTMDAEIGNRSVKLDDISANKDVYVTFNVYADGVAMTDKAAVEAFDPKYTTNVEGCEGTLKVADDGKIIFTPNAAKEPAQHNGSFDVTVTCTLNNGKSASETFTVTVADYKVIATDAKDSVVKTEFFGNDVGVSFYITKDGVQMKKNELSENSNGVALEDKIRQYVAFNDKHMALLESTATKIVVEDNGLIHVIPASDVEHKLTFWNWWINWAYYFGLEGSDVEITLNHPLGASLPATINVVGEDMSYMLLNVYAPLIIEIITLTLLIIWIFLIITKPRYNKGATLFVGEIRYNKASGTHTMRNFSPVKLEKFNKVKSGNGRLKFKATADVVSANGLKIRADRGGRICCEMMFPWYRGKLEPADSDFENLKTPADVSEYIAKHKRLEINEFVTTEAIENDFDRGIAAASASAKSSKYTVVPDSGAVKVVDGKKVINSGKIFIYVNS